MTTEPTLPDILAALQRVLGRPLDSIPLPPRSHPAQEEADNRRIEREQTERWWRGYATPREMDGAAADAWYRDRGGWDG